LDPENVPGDAVLEPNAEPEQTPDVAQPEEAEQTEASAKEELTSEQKTIKALQRRVDRLTAGRGAASREAELLREQLAQLQQKPEGQEDDQRLDPKAIDRLATEKAQALMRQERLATRVQKATAEGSKLAGSAKAFTEACNAVAEEVPFTDAKGVPTAFIEAVLDSDTPAALLNYLGKNPDEAAQFVDLSPSQIGRRLAKLEDRLERDGKEQTSKAPTPLTPVKGAASDSDLHPGLSDAEWLRRREAQLKRR
jgi:hypothetical protein